MDFISFINELFYLTLTKGSLYHFISRDASVSLAL